MNFFQTNKKCGPVLSRVERAKTFLGNETPMIFGLLLLLTTYFGEKEDALIITKDVGASISGCSDCPSTPRLIVFGDMLTSKRFLLSVHGVVVCEDIASATIAVSMLFGLYYVMNLCYPEDAAITLEFLQRSFAKINPERGSKAERRGGKKIHNTHPKLLALTNSLRDFNDQWTLK